MNSAWLNTAVVFIVETFQLGLCELDENMVNLKLVLHL